MSTAAVMPVVPTTITPTTTASVSEATKIKDDVVSFFKNAVSVVRKAKQIWVAIGSTANRTLALTLLKDVLQLVADAEKAGTAELTNITYDTAVLADAKVIIADAKAGDAVIKSDLALLGVTL